MPKIGSEMERSCFGEPQFEIETQNVIPIKPYTKMMIAMMLGERSRGESQRSKPRSDREDFPGKTGCGISLAMGRPFFLISRPGSVRRGLTRCVGGAGARYYDRRGRTGMRPSSLLRRPPVIRISCRFRHFLQP